MKNIIALFLILTCGQLFAQDIIIKKNGEEIKSKVEEITTDLVKYREFDNLTGPLYNIPLAEVFMIKYQNGTSKFYGDKQDTKAKAPATLTDTVAQLKKEINKISLNSKYDELMKKSKSNKSGGILGCVTGPLFLVTGGVTLALSSSVPDETRGLTIAMGSVLVVGGAILTILGPISLAKSKKQYNEAQQYKGQAYMDIPSINLTSFDKNTGICIGTRITF